MDERPPREAGCIPKNESEEAVPKLYRAETLTSVCAYQKVDRLANQLVPDLKCCALLASVRRSRASSVWWRPDGSRNTGPRSSATDRVVLACDFFVAVTVRFRVLYVFVVLDVGTRRIVQYDDTLSASARSDADAEPSYPHGHSALFRASGRHAGGRSDPLSSR